MARKKRKLEGRASDGSGGHFCWSLGQQLLLEGGRTLMARSTGKAREIKAHIQWGCELQAKRAFPGTMWYHDFLMLHKGTHKKSLQTLAPTRKDGQHASHRGAWACGSCKKDRGTSQWKKVCTGDRVCSRGTRWGMSEQAGLWGPLFCTFGSD